MVKKKHSKSIRKPRSLKKDANQSRERVRLEGLVSDLSKVRDDLGKKIQQQTEEIKLKNGQLRQGEEKQVKSESEPI